MAVKESDTKQTRRGSIEFSQPPNISIEPAENTEQNQNSAPSPTLPKLIPTVKNKTKKRTNKVHSQPPILKEEPILIEIPEEKEASVSSPALPKLTLIAEKPKRVRAKSSKPPVLTTEPVAFQEDQVVITSTASPKAFVKKKRVKKESSNPPVLQAISTVTEKQEKLPATDVKSAGNMECSPSFAGIISHNAALLEKGFDVRIIHKKFGRK